MAKVINSRGDLGAQRSVSVEVIGNIDELDIVEPADFKIIDLNDDEEDQEVASSGAIDIKDGTAGQDPVPVNVNDTPKVEEMIAELETPFLLEQIKPQIEPHTEPQTEIQTETHIEPQTEVQTETQIETQTKVQTKPSKKPSR